MDLSDEQNKAMKAVLSWINNKKEKEQIFIFGGIAGSGKTTCINYIKNELNMRTIEMVYTGMASLVLKQNGNPNAKTIHSTIYNTRKGADGKPIHMIKKKEEMEDIDMFIVDECSMINESMFNDILSFKKKVLFVGDHKQLPPIKGNGILTHPDVELNECHRVALENPLTWLSQEIRMGRFALKNQVIGNEIVIINQENLELARKVDQIITTTHKNRIRFNAMYRKYLGFDDMPRVDDRVVCKKNDWSNLSFSGLLKTDVALVNGMSGTIEKIERNGHQDFWDTYNKHHSIAISNIDFKPNLDINTYKGIESDYASLLHDRKQSYKFDTRDMNFFEYAYALSLYSCQGSQYGSVYYHHKPFGAVEVRASMLYTGVTRAKNKLVLQY